MEITEIIINPNSENYLVIKDTKNNRSIIDGWADYFLFKFKGAKYILIYNPYDLIVDEYDFDPFYISEADADSDELLEAAITAELIGTLKLALTEINLRDIRDFKAQIDDALTNTSQWPTKAFEHAREAAIDAVEAKLAKIVRYSGDTYWYEWRCKC